MREFDRVAAAVEALLDLPRRVAALETLHREMIAEIRAIRRALPPTLLPVEDAARVLHVSSGTVRRRVKDGTLPSVRLRGRVLIDVSRIQVTDAETVTALAVAARAPRGGEQSRSLPSAANSRWSAA